MRYVTISNEFIHGPLWFYDEEEDTDDPFDIVENDQIVKELETEIGDLYDSFFDFDTLEIFIFKKEMEHIDEMLDLVAKLKKRLEEINDGSYIVKDYETEELLKDKEEHYQD